MDEDPWEAFEDGERDDDDDDNDNDDNDAANKMDDVSSHPIKDKSRRRRDVVQALTLFLVQHYLKQKVKLTQIAIRLDVVDGGGGGVDQNMEEQGRILPPPRRQEDHQDEEEEDDGNDDDDHHHRHHWASQILRSKGFAVSQQEQLQEQPHNESLSDDDQEKFDAAVVFVELEEEEEEAYDHKKNTVIADWMKESLERSIVPGGLLALEQRRSTTTTRNNKESPENHTLDGWDSNVWHFHRLVECITTTTTINNNSNNKNYSDMIVLQKWTCPIQNHPSCCPWLPSQHMVEQERIEKASVGISVHEQTTKRLSLSSIERAVKCLRQYGYCIIPQILHAPICQEYGTAILSDLDQAANILLETQGVNLFHPNHHHHRNHRIQRHTVNCPCERIYVWIYDMDRG